MSRRSRPPMSFQGATVTLVGLGTFGGGVGAARYLVREGADLLITDRRGAEDLAPSLEALEGLPIRYRLGEHRDEDVSGADWVVLSPAIPPDHHLIQAARAGGAALTSPLNILWERLPSRPVGVTGTRGKTTTATLLHAMLVEHGADTLLGGNVGGSLLDHLQEIFPQTVVVLELSSFQLQWIRELRESPRLSVITNFSSHHLDWHGDLARYASAKRAALEFQRPSDTAVLNGDDETLREWGAATRGDVLWFSTEGMSKKGAALKDGEIRIDLDEGEEAICSLEEIPLRGAFQVENVMAAALGARSLGVPAEAIRRAVIGFPGLPHRLEKVAAMGGVSYYNDSKATTPSSAAGAIEAFDGPIFWIGGGKETGEPLAPILRAAAGRVSKAYLVGEAGPRILKEAADAIPDRVLCRSIEEAVRLARDEATEGGTVLLSPGCASYDQFLNYEQRGDLFRSLVLRKEGT